MTDQEGLATLQRLRRLHAMAFGLYLARRLMGEDGEPQKKRLLWLECKILIYEHFEKKQRTMKVFIIVEDCGNDETRNVACLGTKEEAEAFCNERNTSRPYRFNYEEWEIGEIIGMKK